MASGLLGSARDKLNKLVPGQKGGEFGGSEVPITINDAVTKINLPDPVKKMVLDALDIPDPASIAANLEKAKELGQILTQIQTQGVESLSERQRNIIKVALVAAVATAVVAYLTDEAAADEGNRGGGKKPSEMTAEERRAYYRSKGIPDSMLGPSGYPKVHSVEHPTRKEAEDAASQEGKGPPMQHKGHFHPTDEEGEKEHPNVHHNYPE
jgi:hypothetical protein